MPDTLEPVLVRDADSARRDIVAFLYGEEVARDPAALEKWVWRYVRCPSGKGIATMMADTADGDRIVGHSALALTRVISDGEVFTVGFSGGLRVDEAYRSRGVFVRIQRAEEEAGRADGLPLLASLPNAMAIPGFRLAGYRFQQRFEFAVKALVCLRRDGLWRPVRLVQQAGLYLVNRAVRSGPRCRAPEDLRIERLHAFGTETDDLWSRVGGRGYLGIVKDARYLAWRYGERPNLTSVARVAYVKGRPRAMCIVEQREGAAAGWVAELLARPEDEEIALAVLAEAERQAARSGLRYLRGLTDGVSVTGSVLNRLGYVRQGVRPFLVRVLDESRAASLTGPWTFSMGDFHVGA